MDKHNLQPLTTSSSFIFYLLHKHDANKLEERTIYSIFYQGTRTWNSSSTLSLQLSGFLAPFVTFEALPLPALVSAVMVAIAVEIDKELS